MSTVIEGLKEPENVASIVIKLIIVFGKIKMNEDPGRMVIL